MNASKKFLFSGLAAIALGFASYQVGTAHSPTWQELGLLDAQLKPHEKQLRSLDQQIAREWSRLPVSAEFKDVREIYIGPVQLARVYCTGQGESSQTVSGLCSNVQEWYLAEQATALINARKKAAANNIEALYWLGTLGAVGAFFGFFASVIGAAMLADDRRYNRALSQTSQS